MNAESLAEPSVRLALVAAGGFFLSGLLTGVWKYGCIAAHAKAEAPAYVDIAHRASLMYSFAALLLAVFASISAWSDTVDLWSVALPLLFFAVAIVGYVVHGLLRDTDNQFRRPQTIGPVKLPRHGLLLLMVALTVAEIGGFVVLFAGVLRRLELI